MLVDDNVWEPAVAQELVPPLLNAAHGSELLVEQPSGAWWASEVDLIYVHLIQEMVHEGFLAAIFEFIRQGLEVNLVLHVTVTHIQHEETSLSHSGRGYPLRVGGDDQVDVVVDGVAIFALRLHEERVFGDEPFQNTFGYFVASPDAFVREDQDARCQVLVEASRELGPRSDVQVVGAEQLPKRIDGLDLPP